MDSEKKVVPQSNVELVIDAIRHLGDTKSGYSVKFLRRTIDTLYNVRIPKSSLRKAMKTLVKQGYLMIVVRETGIWTYYTKAQVIKEFSELFQIRRKMTPDLMALSLEGTTSSKERFNRVNLLLNRQRLEKEGFPLPTKETGKDQLDFVTTTKIYRPVNCESKMFAIAGEIWGGSSLAKVVVVSERLVPIYNGVRLEKRAASKAAAERESLKNIQSRIQELVTQYPDCILVGHELRKYLRLMQLTHPYIIDTSVVFQWMGVSGKKPELKTLVKKFLNEEDVDPEELNSPENEAIAALKLIKMELKKGLAYSRSIDPKAKGNGPGYRQKNRKRKISRLNSISNDNNDSVKEAKK